MRSSDRVSRLSVTVDLESTHTAGYVKPVGLHTECNLQLQPHFEFKGQSHLNAPELKGINDHTIW